MWCVTRVSGEERYSRNIINNDLSERCVETKEALALAPEVDFAA